MTNLEARYQRAVMDSHDAACPVARWNALVHLWRTCPDCGKIGAHHPYTNRAGESVGIRCG